MSRDEPHPRRTLVMLCAVAVATVLGWSSVAFVYFGMNAFGRTYPLGRAVLAGLMDWYFWAAVTPPVFWLGQRFRLERSSWAGAVAVHLTAGAGVALVEILTVTAIGRWAGMRFAEGPFLDAWVRMVLQYFHFNFIIYWVIVAAAHAARYYDSYRERALEASRLAAELTQARLLALQMQLHPHFLFNTLHTISTFVREGRTSDATDTIAELGVLLRRTLGDSDRHEASLADEIGFVQGYLGIEQLRFADRLTVTYDVPQDAMPGLLPRMALQTLTENAIRHGIACDPEARHVAIRARRTGDRLHVEVENDGPPVAEGAGSETTRVGLANVRARLRGLYGAACRLDLRPNGRRGMLAVMEVPWRSAY